MSLHRAFALGIRPNEKTDLTTWGREHVVVKRSSRAKNLDLELTPYLHDPLSRLFETKTRELILLAPVGAGKSTFLEFGLLYAAANRPGPALIINQNQDAAREWMQAGLIPALKECEPIKPFLLSDRYAITNKQVKLAHMTLWVNGANLNAVQSKSVDYAIADEAWMYPELLEDLKRRNHDRYGAKTVIVTQAGYKHDGLDREINQCTKYEWHFECRKCGSIQPLLWDNLKYTFNTDDNGPVWATLECGYHCECGEVYRDNDLDRRTIAKTGRYIEQPNPNALANFYCYHFNTLGVWWTKWGDLVQEWVAAQHALKAGDNSLLRVFKQKRLAEQWEEYQSDSGIEDLRMGGFTLGSAKDEIMGGKVLMGVDVQQDHLYYVVAVFYDGGASKVLDYGVVGSFDELKPKLTKWDVAPNSCFIDCAYRPDEVFAFCAKHNQIALNGISSESFEHIDKKTGAKIKRLYGTVKKHQTSYGPALQINFSSKRLKDLFCIVRDGNGAAFELPSDASDKFKRSLYSEIKVAKHNGFEYKQVSEHNHYLDIMCMLFVGAMKWYKYPEIAAG